jgi:multiple antibiotic resistance protein
MSFGIVDVIALLAITLGPLKAAIVYATISAGADKPLRRAIAFRTVAVATIVVLIFIVFGEFILGIFHISLPALKLTGGLILLLFALGMVMGNDQKSHGPEVPVTITMATYPLAMPLMATPRGIVAVVTLAAAKPGLSNLILLAVLSLVIMGLNLIVLLSADKILRKDGSGAMQHPANHSILHDHLQTLRHRIRKSPSALNRLQLPPGRRTADQCLTRQVSCWCGRSSVLTTQLWVSSQPPIGSGCRPRRPWCPAMSIVSFIGRAI